MAGQCVANGTPCRSDATCLEGSCGGCGMPPQKCCEPRLCTASRSVCTGDAVGSCQACGAEGQPCCGDDFCQSGLSCDKSGPNGHCK